MCNDKEYVLALEPPLEKAPLEFLTWKASNCHQWCLKPIHWKELINSGAFTSSLKENDDVKATPRINKLDWFEF